MKASLHNIIERKDLPGLILAYFRLIKKRLLRRREETKATSNLSAWRTTVLLVEQVVGPKDY